MPAGMTRDSAGLFDHEKDRVVVAIEPDLAHPLHMSGLFALAPQPAARARPVMHFPGRRRALERLAVHPRLRQYGAALRLLRDRRDEAVGVPVDFVEPSHTTRFYAERRGAEAAVPAAISIPVNGSRSP